MAEESKQSGLENDELQADRSIGSLSLEDNYPDLEESLDFDIYIDDIPLIAEENSDSSQTAEDILSKNVAHFTDPDSSSPGPIPLNLSSFKEEDNSDYSDLESKRFSEDDLDDILLKDETVSNFDDEDGPIALSSDELNNITDSDYSEDYESSSSDNGLSQFTPNQSFDSDELNDTYDTELGDDEDITLGSEELDHILNPDEDEPEIENEFETKSFFDTEIEEEDGPIALSSDELNNITDSDYSDASEFDTDEFVADPPPNLFDESVSDEEGEIALSGDELNNLLESGNIDEEDFEEGEAKSFFDSEVEEEDESIALSPDELSNITDVDYEDEDGIQTDDLSSGIESNEYGVSTESIFDANNDEEDQNIALSGDELNNILETGQIEVEDETNEDSEENTKSFFDSEEEDESIALSPDELGNITAEEDFESEISSGEENFDLSESSDDFNLDTPSSLFEESDQVEDEEIALSGDELDNILQSGEVETEEADSMGSSLFENTEEDESIALSPDELGNITAEEDFELDSVASAEDSVAEGDNFDLSESSDDFNFDTPSNLFGEAEEVEDEEIALSGDELDNILQSGDIETEEAADNSNPIDSGMLIEDDDFVIDENSSALANLGDFNLEDSAPEDLSDSEEKVDSFHFGSVKKEELKKVISYMDELLGSLPDSYIKEFASSEYFELYKKIMNELEL